MGDFFKGGGLQTLLHGLIIKNPPEEARSSIAGCQAVIKWTVCQAAQHPSWRQVALR